MCEHIRVRASVAFIIDAHHQEGSSSRHVTNGVQPALDSLRTQITADFPTTGSPAVLLHYKCNRRFIVLLTRPLTLSKR